MMNKEMEFEQIKVQLKDALEKANPDNKQEILQGKMIMTILLGIEALKEFNEVLRNLCDRVEQLEVAQQQSKGD